jgi:dTDP-4-amino-4,6-dideoxygalactose transaminase
MKKRIYLSPPHMGGNEMKYVQEAFDTNWIAPLGPNVDGFELELSNYTGINHVAALSTGTAAIHLALLLLGVKKDDEVLVSSFTFSGSVNPIIYCGANPVFIDSERLTWNMDPVLLEKAIVSRMKAGTTPKAIILVHLYGMPAQIEEIIRISEKYNIPIIEDAAEALGSKYKNIHLGNFGRMAVLSFNGNKIITTSSGGALLSPEKELVEKARFLSMQSRENELHYLHKEVGYNYRMSNIIAGVGRGQLEVVDEHVQRCREINQFYREQFEAVDGVEFLTEPDAYYSNYWLTTITVDKSKSGFSSHELMMAFEEDNIESRPLWKPMHQQPVFEEYLCFSNGVSDELFEFGLCLPSGTQMDEQDLGRIKKVIHELINHG